MRSVNRLVNLPGDGREGAESITAWGSPTGGRSTTSRPGTSTSYRSLLGRELSPATVRRHHSMSNR